MTDSSKGKVTKMIMNEIEVWHKLGQILFKKETPAGTDLWQTLTIGQRLTVTSLYFLLGQDEKGQTIERFVTQTLTQLLGQLERDNERRLVENRGQIRGRVNWPATYKARYTQDYDPGRFLCQEVHHRYDIPENQMLKYVAQQIQLCLDSVPEEIRLGWSYFPAGPDSNPIAQRLGRMETALVNFRRHVYLRQVTLPPRLSEQHILRVETSRTEAYRIALAVHRRHLDFVSNGSWAKLLDSGRSMLLLPGRGDSQWLHLCAAILQS